VTVLVAVGAVAGCGGGDEPAGREAVVKRPTPEGRLESQLPEFNRALAHRDCEEYEALVLSFARGRPPGAPAKPEECKDRDTAYEDLLDRRVVASSPVRFPRR
jgi:hypothetical protein